jgi:hypothetical protein
VSVEELGVVKQANSAYVLVGIHPSFWHRADGTEGWEGTGGEGVAVTYMVISRNGRADQPAEASR